MQSKSQPHPHPSQLTITDIYHVIFKHKWMILILSILGLGVAASFYALMPPPYRSEAKLLIRYVEDAKAFSGPSNDAHVQQVDSQGTGVLESEADILTSLDVMAAAADAVGVDKILGKNSDKTNREVAALAIRKGLTVDVPRRGNVLEVSFSHPDVGVVQLVLRKVIDAYYKKHAETHKNLGVLDNFLTEETDRLAQSLRQTEEELRALKSRAGVVSLEESRKTHSERYAKLQEELDAATTELAERNEALKELQKAALVDGAGGAADSTSRTNTALTAGITNAPTELIQQVPSDLAAEYKRICDRLDAAVKQESEVLLTYTPESSRAQEASQNVASLAKQKKAIEIANPRLLDQPTMAGAVLSQPGRRTNIDLVSEQARVAGLHARIQALTNQFTKIRSQAGMVDEVETSYLALQRKKDLQEQQYKYYSKSLDQARVDSQLGAGKLPNISEIQSPSLPLRNLRPLQKKMAMAAAGGIGGALGLAFLLELILSQSVRKPAEIEKNFDVPVFLTIPKLDPRGNGHAYGGAAAQLPEHSSADDDGSGMKIVFAPVDSAHSGQTLPASTSHNGSETGLPSEDEAFHPYSEALRDRLVSFFEIKGMTHKPKLIALTSCSKGAGVTTLAAGLAASLSETGEGNVLLVDLNGDRGSVHPFFRGKLACGLADVLNGENREAMVQRNLHVVRGTGGDDQFSKVLPKRLAHLIPKLQTSGYDYIIFDMPPVTQTSVTPRLAGLMDMIFMVVEDQKTNREWLKQATQLLQQSNVNLGAVFNKRRTYTPRWLHQEF